MDLTEEFEDRVSFIHNFIIRSLTGINICETIKARPRYVTMQINGVDIDPLNALNRLEEEYEGLVKEEAKKLSEEVLQDVIIPFEDKIYEIIKFARERIEKINKGG